jgi:hypothetical protein
VNIYIYIYSKVNMAHSIVYVGEDIRCSFLVGWDLVSGRNPSPVVTIPYLPVLLMGKLRQRKTGEQVRLILLIPPWLMFSLSRIWFLSIWFSSIFPLIQWGKYSDKEGKDIFSVCFGPVKKEPEGCNTMGLLQPLFMTISALLQILVFQVLDAQPVGLY